MTEVVAWDDIEAVLEELWKDQAPNTPSVVEVQTIKNALMDYRFEAVDAETAEPSTGEDYR